MKSILYFIQIVVFCLLLSASKGFAGHDTKEKAFYALSSVCYFLETKFCDLQEDDIIDFQKNDIDRLFQIAKQEPSLREKLKDMENQCDLVLTSQIVDDRSLLKEIKKILKKLEKDIIDVNDDLSMNYKGLKHHHLNRVSFENNPNIDQEMKKMMLPYGFPLNHPLASLVNEIFLNRITENEETFQESGFVTLYAQPTSYIRVAKHPLLKGLLVKLYLDNETRLKDRLPGWKWLVRRCQGAENVRKLIKRKQLHHFVVPDKWIYPLPIAHVNHDQTLQPVILIVTDMELVSEEETKNAWKTKVTKKHLDELFCILSHGYSSCYLATNIPYTKNGKFTCIDTEHPKRKLKYSHVRPYLSRKMQKYWETLVKEGGRV